MRKVMLALQTLRTAWAYLYKAQRIAYAARQLDNICLAVEGAPVEGKYFLFTFVMVSTFRLPPLQKNTFMKKKEKYLKLILLQVLF